MLPILVVPLDRKTRPFSTSSLYQFEQIQTSLDKFRHIWTNLFNFWPICTNSDQFGQCFTNLIKFTPVWTLLDKFEQDFTYLENNGTPQCFQYLWFHSIGKPVHFQFREVAYSRPRYNLEATRTTSLRTGTQCHHPLLGWIRPEKSQKIMKNAKSIFLSQKEFKEWYQSQNDICLQKNEENQIFFKKSHSLTFY